MPTITRGASNNTRCQWPHAVPAKHTVPITTRRRESCTASATAHDANNHTRCQQSQVMPTTTDDASNYTRCQQSQMIPEFLWADFFYDIYNIIDSRNETEVIL